MDNRPRHLKIGNCGLTPKEAEVMNLWDGGYSIEQIAGQTGRGVKSVRKLVAMYHVSSDANGDADRSVRAGSHALLNAMRMQGMLLA